MDIEKAREEFESDLKCRNKDIDLSRNQYYGYVHSHIEARWDSYLSAKKSAQKEIDNLKHDLAVFKSAANEYLKETFDLKEELIKWKNHHNDMVARARILHERTDLPLERISAYKDMQQLQEENKLLKADIKALRRQDESKFTALLDIQIENEKLKSEIEILRLYANKDCLAMADDKLEEIKAEVKQSIGQVNVMNGCTHTCFYKKLDDGIHDLFLHENKSEMTEERAREILGSINTSDKFIELIDSERGDSIIKDEDGICFRPGVCEYYDTRQYTVEQLKAIVFLMENGQIED